MKNTYYIMSVLAASLALSSCLSDNEGWGKPRVHRSTVSDSVLTETTATKPSAMDMLVANSSRISQTQPKQVYNEVEAAPVLPPLPEKIQQPVAPAPQPAPASPEPALDSQLIETQELPQQTPAGSWTQQQPAPEVQTPVPTMPQTPVSKVQPEPVVKQAPQPKQESPTVGEVAQNQPTAAAQQPKQEPVKPVVNEAPKPQPIPVRQISAPSPTQQQPAATVQTRPVVTRPVTPTVTTPAPQPVYAPRPVITPAQKKRYPVMPGQNRGLKLRD